MRAVLRRVGGARQSEQGISLSGIDLDTKRHIVRAGGAEVELTLKEFELLRCLMENPNIVFTRDQLLGSVWGYDFNGETRTVDVHVRTLRQKLGEYGEAVETVRGVGYRFQGGTK